ncbi:MAG: DUF2147 domain-containing protein [Bacteroidia bacterium]
MRPLLFIILTVLFSIAFKSDNKQADQIIGDWISPKRDLIIHCYKENNLYYGKVVWFYKYYPTQPDDPNGVPEKQWVNSIVMNNFFFSDNEWSGGEIHNIKNGKKYDAYIQLINENSLKVTGYVFLRIFSETTMFSRYKELTLPAFN